VERILAKLQRLREADDGFHLFGANSHRYQLGPVLSEGAVAEWEEQFGVTLPQGYRRFLLEAGHGGAGPYYGLFTIDNRHRENATEYEYLARPFPWTERFNPEEFENPCDEEFVECTDGEFMGIHVPGALSICRYGCAKYFVLILHGPCIGEVWHDWQAEGSGLYPAVDGAGRRLGFLQWYEVWLDESLRWIGSA